MAGFESAAAFGDRWGRQTAERFETELRQALQDAGSDEERAAIVDAAHAAAYERFNDQVADRVLAIGQRHNPTAERFYDARGNPIPEDHPTRVAVRDALAKANTPEERAELMTAALAAFDGPP